MIIPSEYNDNKLLYSFSTAGYKSILYTIFGSENEHYDVKNVFLASCSNLNITIIKNNSLIRPRLVYDDAFFVLNVPNCTMSCCKHEGRTWSAEGDGNRVVVKTHPEYDSRLIETVTTQYYYNTMTSLGKLFFVEMNTLYYIKYDKWINYRTAFVLLDINLYYIGTIFGDKNLINPLILT